MNIPAPGSTVHVRWYGKTLQGEVVPDDGRIALFASMVHVRVPIQGTPVIAVFSPSHVYATASEVPASMSPRALPAGSPATTPAASAADPSPALSSVVCAASAETSAPSPSWSTPALDAHRARYRQFKADHWDNEHNHLHVDALEEFYQLFREGVALRRQSEKPATPPQLVRPSQPTPIPQPPKKKHIPQQLSLDF